jgi:plasmid stability protein
MPTLTIRRLTESLVQKIKARAAESGRSMEEEVRNLLDRTYGTADQLARQRAWVARLRRLHAEGRLPKSDVDSAEIIRQMREERDQQLMEAISGPSDRADR